ncbi:MAG: lysozyme inhibitor LprI family protein [Chthoniobacter sp.]
MDPGTMATAYAIALSDSKWEASDVVLVDLADDGATQTDIHQTLDGAVLAYIRAHQKHTGGYATDYQLFSLPEIGLLTGFSDAATVRVPFSSEVPKSDSMRGYSGTLLLHLSTEKGHPRAEPGPIRETKGNPDPAVDDPRLAEADKELNVAYAAVRSKLDAAGKAKLVAEQREWIRQRDLSVAGLSANNAQDSPVANPRIAADRLLLQLTKERTAALRAR